MEFVVEDKDGSLKPKPTPPSLTIHLKSDDLLALYTIDTSQDGPYTRSVYITKAVSNGEPTIVLIENLEFYLYVAIPTELDIDLLMEEMTLSYATTFYGKSSAMEEVVKIKRTEITTLKKSGISGEQLCRATKELSVMNSGLITLNNYIDLQKEYKKLLAGKKGDCDSNKEGDWLKYAEKEMGTKGFFIIKNFKQYHVPKYAAIMKYLENTTHWKFTFDNHEVLQYFLQRFSKPFEMCKVWSEEEEKYIATEKHVIKILDNDGNNPCLYLPSGGGGNPHTPYIIQQTKLFVQTDHFYHWEFTGFKDVKIGRLEPAFLVGGGAGGTGTHNHIVVEGNLWEILNEKKSPMKDHLYMNTVTLRISDFMGGASTIHIHNIKLVDIKTKLHQLTPYRSEGKKVTTAKKKPSTEVKKSQSAVKKQVYGRTKPLAQPKITFGDMSL